MSRLTGLLGVAFAVTYTGGLFMDNGPSQDLSDAATQQWYATHNLHQWLLSSAIIAVAGLFAIGFAVMLHRRIALPGNDRGAGTTIVVAGGVAAALVLIGAALYGTIPAQHTFNGTLPPSADVSRALFGASYAAMVLVAPLAFAVMMGAVAVLGWRYRTLPRWLAVVTVPLALLQFANAVAPMMPLVLWSLLIGFTLTLRTPKPVPATATTATRAPALV